MADAGRQHLQQHLGAFRLRRRLLVELQRLAADADLEHTHCPYSPRMLDCLDTRTTLPSTAGHPCPTNAAKTIVMRCKKYLCRASGDLPPAPPLSDGSMASLALDHEPARAAERHLACVGELIDSARDRRRPRETCQGPRRQRARAARRGGAALKAALDGRPRQGRATAARRTATAAAAPSGSAGWKTRSSASCSSSRASIFIRRRIPSRGRTHGGRRHRRLRPRPAGAGLRHRSAVPAALQADRLGRVDRRGHPLLPVGHRAEGRPRHPLGRRMHPPGQGGHDHPHRDPGGALPVRRPQALRRTG